MRMKWVLWAKKVCTAHTVAIAFDECYKLLINFFSVFVVSFFFIQSTGPSSLFSKVPTNKSNAVCVARGVECSAVQSSMLLYKLKRIVIHIVHIWKVEFHVNTNMHLNCMPIKKKKKTWNERCCFGMCLTRSIQLNNLVAVIDFSSLSSSLPQYTHRKWWEFLLS